VPTGEESCQPARRLRSAPWRVRIAKSQTHQTAKDSGLAQRLLKSRGARYPIECRMDGRIFARFHLDVGIDDIVMQPLETIQGQDWLGLLEYYQQRCA
jgi:hypothetical protein